MRLRVGAASDIGQARERNEDAFLTSHPLYVVADGMGGHRGGEVASKLAVEVVSKDSDSEGMQLADRIREANRTVFERQAGDRSVAGMGTTLTAVVADGDTVRIGHVGDSRAYLLRDGELRLLTEDHTLVHRMVNEGKISEEEAQVHPQRSILTRALGVDEEIDVDEETVDVREGDRLVLCTDGLTSMIREESVQEILEGQADPQQAAEFLVDAANRAGGLDNITVVVMDFGEGEGVEILAPEQAQATADEPVRGAESAPDATGVLEPAQAERPGEETEPAPRPSRLRRWRKPLLWAAAVVVIVVAGIVAFKMYADRQWYVGVENGHVAVYRGIPTTILGVHLSSPVSETRISSRAAERLAPYRELASGITADSRQDADSIVNTIRRDILRERRARRHHKGGGG